FIHCNAAVMAPLVPANVAIEQQAVNLGRKFIRAGAPPKRPRRSAQCRAQGSQARKQPQGTLKKRHAETYRPRRGRWPLADGDRSNPTDAYRDAALGISA